MPVRMKKRWGFPEGMRGGGMPRKISEMGLRDLGMELALYIKGFTGL